MWCECRPVLQCCCMAICEGVYDKNIMDVVETAAKALGLGPRRVVLMYSDREPDMLISHVPGLLHVHRGSDNRLYISHAACSMPADSPDTAVPVYVYNVHIFIFLFIFNFVILVFVLFFIYFQ